MNVDAQNSPMKTRPPSQRRRWTVIALTVAFAHLFLFGLLEGLLTIPVLNQPTPAPIQAQLWSFPSAPVPAPPSTPASPVSQPLAGLVSEALEPPDSQNEPEAVQESTTDQSQTANDIAPGPVDFSTRVPGPDELAKGGSIALKAFWGDFDKGGQIAEGSIELTFPEPGRYAIRLVTEARGWVTMFASKPLFAETYGRIGAGGFIPERYTHQSPRGREETAIFDYQEGKIASTASKEPLPLLKGIQDRLSFMLQLAWMMRTDPDRFGEGATVSLPIASRKKAEMVDFRVMPDDHLILPVGVLVPVIHLSSTRESDRFSGRIDVWLDRTDRHLPVRIRFEEVRGQVVDMITNRTP